MFALNYKNILAGLPTGSVLVQFGQNATVADLNIASVRTSAATGFHFRYVVSSPGVSLQLLILSSNKTKDCVYDSSDETITAYPFFHTSCRTCILSSKDTYSVIMRAQNTGNATGNDFVELFNFKVGTDLCNVNADQSRRTRRSTVRWFPPSHYIEAIYQENSGM